MPTHVPADVWTPEAAKFVLSEYGYGNVQSPTSSSKKAKKLAEPMERERMHRSCNAEDGYPVLLYLAGKFMHRRARPVQRYVFELLLALDVYSHT